MPKDDAAGDPEAGGPKAAAVGPAGTLKIPKWPLLLLGLSLVLHCVTLLLLLLPHSGSSAATPTPSPGDGGDGSPQCGPHGLVQLDAPTTCECHQCWIGPHCESQVAGCILQATSGNPLLFEGYWQNSSLVLPIPAAYRIGYTADGDGGEQLQGLETAIRDLHLMVGNVAPEAAQGHTIVLGVGSTQLLSAAVWAMVQRRKPRVFTSRAPYYTPYSNIVQYYNSSHLQWSDSPDGRDDVVEFVNSPNNPDGSLRSPLYSNATHIFDCAYWWPHFTPIAQPITHDLMLFTLSKLTGHAGSRVGWALVKDAEVAQAMRDYLDLTTFGSPHESQLHAWQLLRSMLANGGQPLLYGAAEMGRRWDRLQAIQALQASAPAFTLQPLAPPQYCRFRQRVAPSSPPYLWLHCANLQPGEDCAQRMLNASGVAGRAGQGYGGTRFQVRLSLLMRPGEFDLLADRLQGWATGTSTA
eukprot:EG_transcript_8920